MISAIRPARVFLFPFLILALAAGFAGQAAFASVAQTVGVGNCEASITHFSTIQAAVNAAPAGSTIKVCPGSYPEQVLITKNLTMIGIQNGTADAAVILPPPGGIVANGTDISGNPVAAQILVNSPGSTVTIERLTVDGTGNNLAGCVNTALEGIYFENTSGTIANNVVRNQYQTDYTDYGGCENGFAINVESTTSASSVTISGNSVRAYQKNGITASGAATGAGSPGPAVTIYGNYIVGFAATAMNWQGVYQNHANAAENGIQVGYGATGKVEFNTVNDNIWGQDTSSDTGDAASGILIFASSNITVTSNEVGSAQFGIAVVTDGSGFCTSDGNKISCGPADSTTITSNEVVGTQLFDGVEACSNHNTIASNTIYGSTQSGVHFDDSCTSSALGTTSGNGNNAGKNIITEACAGILLGTGTGNTYNPNSLFDVTNTTLAGDVCPGGGASADATTLSHVTRKLHPSPYKLKR
jgi:hypothetical protein